MTVTIFYVKAGSLKKEGEGRKQSIFRGSNLCMSFRLSLLPHFLKSKPIPMIN